MAVRSKTLATLCTLAFLSAATLATAADLRVLEAAKRRDLQAVRMLVRQRADVNTPQPDAATALHWAAHWDDLEIADLLLRSGARADTANDYGVTPLSLACTNGSVAMIERLLEAGANPNAALRTTGETPLMTAARTGKADAVKALLARGAKVDAKEANQGQSALMWAAAEGHTEVVKALLEGGAAASQRASKGFTPLLFAAREGHLETTKVLLAAGAKIDETSDDGTTALLIAVIRGHIPYATYFLDHGANPNLGPGFAPLHWAVGDWLSPYTSENLGILAENNEWTPLGGLRGDVKLAFVRVLVAHGADVNARAKTNPRPEVGMESAGGRRSGNLAGGTPFLMAAQAGSADVMRFLIEKGADPLLKTDGNTTAAMLAAGLFRRPMETHATVAQSLEALKLALDLGNDINAVNDNGETALHAPSYLDRPTIAQFLVDRSANLNQKDNDGWTPLTVAEGIYNSTLYQSPDTAEVLRKAGAAPSAPDVQRDSTVTLMARPAARPKL